MATFRPTTTREQALIDNIQRLDTNIDSVNIMLRENTINSNLGNSLIEGYTRERKRKR